MGRPMHKEWDATAVGFRDRGSFAAPVANLCKIAKQARPAHKAATHDPVDHAASYDPDSTSEPQQVRLLPAP